MWEWKFDLSPLTRECIIFIYRHTVLTNYGLSRLIALGISTETIIPNDCGRGASSTVASNTSVATHKSARIQLLEEQLIVVSVIISIFTPNFILMIYSHRL